MERWPRTYSCVVEPKPHEKLRKWQTSVEEHFTNCTEIPET